MNATSTCNSIREIFGKARSQAESLQKVSELLYLQLGLKVEFCEIIGKRWSHLAGHPEFLGFGERFALKKNRGLIIEEISIHKNELKQILDVIENSIKE